MALRTALGAPVACLCGRSGLRAIPAQVGALRPLDRAPVPRQTAPAQASHWFGCPFPLVDAAASTSSIDTAPPCAGEGSHPARHGNCEKSIYAYCYTLFRLTMRMEVISVKTKLKEIHDKLNVWASTHQFDLAAITIIVSAIISSDFAQSMTSLGTLTTNRDFCPIVPFYGR